MRTMGKKEGNGLESLQGMIAKTSARKVDAASNKPKK